MTANVPPAAVSPQDAAGRRWQTAVFVVFGLVGFGPAAWLARVPSARAGLGASTLGMGILAAGIAAGTILGFVVASRLARRLAARTTILVALGAAAAGLALAGAGTAVPEGFAVTLAGLVLMGTGAGTCNVAMNVEASTIERTRARPLMPWFHAVFSIGAAVGATGGAVAAAVHLGVAAHLAATAALMAVGATVAGFWLPSRKEPAPGPARTPGPRGGLRHVFDGIGSRILLVGIVVLGVSFANGAARDWGALAMVDGHGTGDGMAALAVDAFAIAMVVARFGGVWILARMGRVTAMRMSAVVSMTGVLMLIFVPSVAVAVAGMVLWGLGVALGFPVGMSAAGDRGHTASRDIALVAGIGYGGALVGPPVIGFVAEGTGVLGALLIVVAAIAVSGLAAPALREPRLGRSAGT